MHKNVNYGIISKYAGGSDRKKTASVDRPRDTYPKSNTLSTRVIEPNPIPIEI